MDELLKLSLIDLCDAITNRKITPVDLMTAVLDRIEKANPDLNAIVAMRDENDLMADAKKAEERISRGEARPLEGIPFGVKDLEDAAGLVNSQGCLLYKDNIAKNDSTQVARLRQAGGIMLGKTNTPEFGCTAITKNLVYGVTRSPWNPELTPGGSSGGSSAALTGGLLPLVTGSDGGGSIRIPASFTGAFGLKPTFGRIPMGPKSQWSYGDTSHYGPITKTVEDAAFFMDQVVGYSPEDPTSLPHPGFSFQERLKSTELSNLKIAFSIDFGYAVVQSDVAEAVENSAKLFEKMGHTLNPIDDGPPPIGMDWNLISGFENASKLVSYLPEREGEISEFYLSVLKRVSEIPPERWGVAAVLRNAVNEWCTKIFSEYDLLITPTVPYDPVPAPGPFPVMTEGRPQIDAAVAVFTIPFNQTGLPAATVRAGLSKIGMPIGMQIVGPRYREDLVLAASQAFEKEQPWHPNWPF